VSEREEEEEGWNLIWIKRLIDDSNQLFALWFINYCDKELIGLDRYG